MVVPDIQALVTQGRTFRGGEGSITRSWLGVPMVTQGRVIGLIVLEKFEPNFYSEDQASTVFALARQAGIAVENARLIRTNDGSQPPQERVFGEYEPRTANTFERDYWLQRTAA